MLETPQAAADITSRPWDVMAYNGEVPGSGSPDRLLAKFRE